MSRCEDVTLATDHDDPALKGAALSDHDWPNLPGEDENPFSSGLRDQVTEFVRDVLTREERLVVTLHYCEGLRTAEIAAVLDMSEMQVRNMHQDVVRRVKQWVLAHRKSHVGRA